MQLLAGHPRYEIIRELGAGGMGVVYEAHDHEREARVALKTIQSTDPVAVSRFKAEFRAIADVIHPNLVALYELVSDHEVPFFTMELVHGAHFVRWIRTGNRTTTTVPDWTGTATAPTGIMRVPPPRRAQQTRGDASVVDMERLRSSMRQLAEAVAAIHEANLLHRDLKPSNVLVTDANRVVVLDFGLVLNVEDSLGGPAGEDRALMGTIAYMSPEQAGRMPLTSASDWYSVGVMLYVALTGREPFLGDKREVLASKQEREPASPASVAEGIPPDLNALCMRLLRRDPQERPGPQEILRLLGSTATVLSATTRTSLGAPAVLVGREPHLERLREALAATRDGGAVAVHLRGRSGSGKSSLVARFLDEVRGRDGAVVLSGRCYERESGSYKAVDGVIEALCANLLSRERAEVEALLPPDVEVLQRVFPALRRVESIAAARPHGPAATDPYELRRRAFATLRELLARMARDAPTVIFVDDLQWGDADSAPLLEALVRPPGEPALLLIAAYRSEDESTQPLLAELLSRQWSAGVAVQSMTVQELTESEALELARTLLADAGLPADLAPPLVQDAAGNAFYVHELVRFAQTQAAGRESITAQGVDEVIAARIARMPREARRVLEFLAVAGRPVPRGIVQQATEVRDTELMTVLKILRAGSLVRMTGVRTRDMLEPYHDRVAETLVARLDTESRREHHHRLALAYQSSETPDAEALARHFRHAGLTAEAARYARLAADNAAAALAFARAAELYDDALTLGEFDAAERRELLTRMGDARKSAGLGAESAAAYLEAAQTATEAQALELRRRAAVQQLYSGHLAEGTDTLGRVLEGCGFRLPTTPRRAFLSVALLRARFRLRGVRFRQRDEADLTPRELVRIDVCHGAASGLGLVDFIRATEFQTRGLLLALDSGEATRVARAIAVEVVMASVKGPRVERRMRELIAVVEELARDSQDPIMRAWRHAAPTNLEYQLGHFARTRDHAAAAIAELATAPGMYWEISSAAIFGLWAQYYLGTWRTLDARVRELTDEARERGDLYTRTNLRVGLFNAMWLARDDVEGARREAADAMAPWPDRDFHLQHYWALLSSVQCDLYAGDGRAAQDRIERASKRLRTSMLHRITTVRVEFSHMRARAALMLADLKSAERCARELARERMSWASAFAELAFAAIAHARGGRDAAIAALERAERAAVAADMAIYASATRYRRGELLGGDEGDALVTAATAHLSDEGIANPRAMVDALAPIPSMPAH